MKLKELNREKLKELSEHYFRIADALDHPERFKEIELDPLKIDDIRRKLLSLSREILSEGGTEETELISSCIRILGRCSIKEKELYGRIIDCLIGCMNRSSIFAVEATRSLERLADVASSDALKENRIGDLVQLIETGDDEASWNGAYALGRLAGKVDRDLLQGHIGRVSSAARSNTSFRKANSISCLGKLYQYSNSSKKEEILDTLLHGVQDPDEKTRRASIFALAECISDGTKDRILNCFEDLLEDEAKTVKYGALEALTEVLPYRISDKAFDEIQGFLEADEQWIRWRVALALNKAYPELDTRQKEKAVSILKELIHDEDIFVKVRAYEALMNIKEIEKKEIPEVGKALKEETDFVRQWVLYFP